jgi:hypothetical protein
MIVAAASLFSGTAGPVAMAKRLSPTDPPPFFVRLEVRRAIFYHDESIGFGIFRRSDKPESAGCNFGGSGQSVQMLKNGRVIKEYPVGPVSRTAPSIIGGVRYQSFGGNASLVNIVSDEDVNLKNYYQIRVTCGQEISEPSTRFRLSPWSEPVDGLTVLIRAMKTEFHVDEAIKVEARMRNVGNRARRCPMPLVEDGHSIGFWKLEPYWNDPRPVPDHYLERSLKMLQPGESRSAIFELNNFRGSGTNKTPRLGSQPGTYRVWFSVFFHQNDEDIPMQYRKNLWREELTTNIIKIVVK